MPLEYSSVLKLTLTRPLRSAHSKHSWTHRASHLTERSPHQDGSAAEAAGLAASTLEPGKTWRPVVGRRMRFYSSTTPICTLSEQNPNASKCLISPIQMWFQSLDFRRKICWRESWFCCQKMMSLQDSWQVSFQFLSLGQGGNDLKIDHPLDHHIPIKLIILPCRPSHVQPIHVVTRHGGVATTVEMPVADTGCRIKKH